MKYYMQWGIAYAFAIASAVLASAYGFLSAVGFYAWAKAAILCLVAFGGCHGPAYIAKLQRSVGWPGSALAILATAACLLVTLWGGLGTIAGGGAEMRAERQKAASDALRDRETLSTLKAARKKLDPRPADVVNADLATFRASPLYKATDSCEPDKIIGPKAREHCKQYRQLEGELASAKEAARLDGEIATVDGRLAHAPPPVEADPQAMAFSRLTTLSVELSAALYAFAASVGLELMAMVAMMVAWSDQKRVPARESDGMAKSGRATRCAAPVAAAKSITPPQAGRQPLPTPNVVPIRPGVYGSIRKFVQQGLVVSAGDRLKMGAVFTAYQAWCLAGQLTPASLEKFLEDIRGACEKADIAIETASDAVYCLDVRLAA